MTLRVAQVPVTSCNEIIPAPLVPLECSFSSSAVVQQSVTSFHERDAGFGSVLI